MHVVPPRRCRHPRLLLPLISSEFSQLRHSQDGSTFGVYLNITLNATRSNPRLRCPEHGLSSNSAAAATASAPAKRDDARMAATGGRRHGILCRVWTGCRGAPTGRTVARSQDTYCSSRLLRRCCAVPYEPPYQVRRTVRLYTSQKSHAGDPIELSVWRARKCPNDNRRASVRGTGTRHGHVDSPLLFSKRAVSFIHFKPKAKM